MIKIEIKSVFGKVLFIQEKDNNTVKDTLVEAVKNGADLRGADLGGADLGGANLRCANLRGADLGGANLCGADLGGADLRGANLRCANLRGWGKISSTSDILILGPIGSRNDYITIYHTDKGIFIRCGCFSGTIDEFAKKVKETHKGNKHERDYLAMVDFVKRKFEYGQKDI